MAVYDRRKRDPGYRGTKPWVVDYADVSGKRRSPGFATKKEAEAYYRDAVGEVATGRHNPRAASVTFAQAADAYVADLERRHRLGHRMTGYTLRRYRSIVDKHLRPALGRIKLSELTVQRCQALIDKMAADYVHQYRDATLVIYMIIKLAVKHGMIACNPLGDDRIELAPRKKSRAPKFERKDLRRLLAAIEKPLPGEKPYTHENRAAVIMLAMFCALRRGEIAGLQIEHLDFTNKLIGVQHSHSTVDGLKDTKTVAGFRWVPMIPVVEVALRAIVDRAAASGRHTGYLFLGRADSKSIYFAINRDYFMRTMLAAGLATDDGKRFKNDRRPRGTAPKFTFHDLRHAGISLMIEQGMPVLEVCKIAGHANANITLSIYAHLFNDKSTALGTVTKISDSLLPMQHQRNKALPSY